MLAVGLLVVTIFGWSYARFITAIITTISIILSPVQALGL